MIGAVDGLATLLCYTVTATDSGIHRLWEKRILLTRFVQWHVLHYLLEEN